MPSPLDRLQRLDVSAMRRGIEKEGLRVLPDGTLAGARPGSGNFSVLIHGRSAHAGRNPEDMLGMPLQALLGTELFERPFASPTGVTGFQTGDQGIGHYVLSVPDVDAALAFYTKALGFQLADVIDWTIGDGLSVTLYFLYCNGRHHSFAFAKLPGSKRLHHFMLQTNSMDDVGLAYDRFDAERAIVMTLGRHTNDHMISFYGATPSGFAVEYGWGAREVTRHWSVVRYDRISIWGHKFQAPA